MKILDFLEERGVPYRNLQLYVQAFTHSSYANEHKGGKDYERLEFMGDAVLQLYVSRYIFALRPDDSEGQLTTLRSKLVREESLARFARELGLDKLILLGVGEERSGGRNRDSVLCDVFESFTGALYLDCGEAEVMRMLEKTIFAHVDDVAEVEEIKDFKTKLQELIQADDRRSVQYVVVKETGPANAPEFTVEVRLENMTLGRGKGTSKKRAEQQAARDALNKMASE